MRLGEQQLTRRVRAARRHFTILAERLEQLGCTYGSLSVHNGPSPFPLPSLTSPPLPSHHLTLSPSPPPPPDAGLWESATQTSHSLLSRLAIVALVHEARGLDTNPVQIRRCRAAGDEQTARVLEVVHADEICVRSPPPLPPPLAGVAPLSHRLTPLRPSSSPEQHVAAGHRHFASLCASHRPHPLDPVAQFRAEVRAHFFGALRGPFNEGDRQRAGMGSEWYEGLGGRGVKLQEGAAAGEA